MKQIWIKNKIKEEETKSGNKNEKGEEQLRIEDAINGYENRIMFMLEQKLDFDYMLAVYNIFDYLLWQFEKNISLSDFYFMKCFWLGEKIQFYKKLYKKEINGIKKYEVFKYHPYFYYIKKKKILFLDYMRKIYRKIKEYGLEDIK